MTTVRILSREFETNKVTPGNKEFDDKTYRDYCDYLMSIPETDVIKMEIKHAYQRMRLISMREQPKILKELGYIPPGERDDFASRKGSDKKSGNHPSWRDD